MKTQELQELVGLARLRYDQEQGAMAAIAAREQSVRKAISEIDAQFERAATTPPEHLAAMQRVGAQHLWADQARRRRAALIRDLSLILAEKSEQKLRLRYRMGQRDALKDLHGQAQKEHSEKRAARLEETRVAAQLAAPARAIDFDIIPT